MEAFTMEIAGLAVGVEPLFESTKEYCRPYLTDKCPELAVRVTEADLVYEQQLFEEEAIREGLKIRKFTGPFLERASIQRRVANRLLRDNTLMLHGSTVSVDGKAYLFTAPCGTGKSTHTRLWRELFGERAVMVNDDKPFLRITDFGVLAYGSPWSGKHGLATNICVPLRGICLLHRGNENVIRRVKAEQMVDFLCHQAHDPIDNQLTEHTRYLVEQIVSQIPLWEMHCNKNPEAAEVAYRVMSAPEE